jgi:hypothetical protein
MEEVKKPGRGGRREGAGRKKKYAKPYYFNATEEVMVILEAIPSKQRTDFINECILKAAGGGK